MLFPRDLKLKKSILSDNPNQSFSNLKKMRPILLALPKSDLNVKKSKRWVLNLCLFGPMTLVVRATATLASQLPFITMKP